MTLANKFFTAIAVLLVALIFVGGCEVGKRSVHCPEITTDTVTVHDTVIHYITNTEHHYINHTDTIIIVDTIPADVDTVAILHDYFSTHVYNRNWEDDTLKITVIDSISQNRSIGNLLSYVVKVPFKTVINNVDQSTTYNRYFNLGLNIPLKDVRYLELQGLYIWEKGHIGASYSYQLKSFGISFGANIIKFKKKT